MIKPDSNLETYEEIRERLSSVRRQRERLVIAKERGNSIDAWEKKKAKFRKLNERECNLLIALKSVQL